jgi:hypothetical protein
MDAATSELRAPGSTAVTRLWLMTCTLWTATSMRTIPATGTGVSRVHELLPAGYIVRSMNI